MIEKSVLKNKSTDLQDQMSKNKIVNEKLYVLNLLKIF